jgi:hypothetical protein
MNRVELNLTADAANQYFLPIDGEATGCSWANGGNMIILGTMTEGAPQTGDLVYSPTTGIPLWSTVKEVTQSNSGIVSAIVQCLGNSETPLTAAGSNANVTFYKPLAVDKYASSLLQIFGTFVASATLYGSNDGINFSPVSAALNGVITSPITTNGMFNIPLGFPYLAVLCTAYTSGTMNGSMSFNFQPIPSV